MQNNFTYILREKVRIRIPKGFESVSEEQVKTMFLGTVPDIVYGVVDKKAFISITRTDNLLVDTDLEKRISRYYQAYGRSVPHFANSGIAKKKLQDGTTIGVFHYTSTTIDRDMLNYFVLFPVEGKEVVMTMHCSIEDSLAIGSQFLAVLNSITIC